MQKRVDQRIVCVRVYTYSLVVTFLAYIAGILNHGEILQRMSFTNITEMQTRARISRLCIGISWSCNSKNAYNNVYCKYKYYECRFITRRYHAEMVLVVFFSRKAHQNLAISGFAFLARNNVLQLDDLKGQVKDGNTYRCTILSPLIWN